jgi:hypothetical protein
MSPILLLPLSFVVPAAMAVIALVPGYAGFYYAAKIIYGIQDTDLSPYALNVFYILRVYRYLFEYWLQHIEQASFLEYTLPLFAVPLVGITFSILGSIIFVSYMLKTFRQMV